MSELTSRYRERLERMAGGRGASSGRNDAKSSSTVSRRTRESSSLSSSRPSGSPAGYQHMRNEMKTSRVSARSDAAALQNDLAQRFNLQSAIRPSQKKRRNPSHAVSNTSQHGQRGSNISSNPQPTSTPASISCESCQALNPSNCSVCRECGYFMSGSHQVPLTMAQSRGLIAAPKPNVEALKDFEWESIEKDLATRHDAFCPICMEGFRGYEVLLSCSHMYHRSCLQSFEKFMKTAERSCPICRTTNYQKKITHVGTKAYEIVCAGVIQRNWRGFWCRNLYYEELKRFYKNGGISTSSCRKKFYEKELSSHTDRLAKEGASMEHEVNSLFSSMDKVMQDNRDLDAAFDLMMMERHNFGGVSEYNLSMESQTEDISSQSQDKYESGEVSRAQWNDILQHCLNRGDNVECAICMSEIEKNRNRRVVLLSCSHMFHQQCIMMLEDFVKNAEDCPLCPMCRCPFERKLLSRDCTTFDAHLR